MPVLIDVLRLAKKGCSLDGHLRVSQMPRLTEMLTSNKGVVKVELEFGLDPQHIPYLKGRITTLLELTCQRCLESMDYPIDHQFLLGIVTSEKGALKLPDEYEPLQVNDEPSRLAEIIEDELILSLPVVAMHKEDECPASKILLRMDKKLDTQTVQDAGPFAKLGDLLKQDLK